MIEHDCDQGSEAWHRLRLGIPTASCFGKILTPSKLELSASGKPGGGYYSQLLTEWVLRKPVDGASSGWIQRGHELEGQGRIAYSWEHSKEVREVGFITNDAQTWGYSPDGLVGDDGLLELKACSAVEHLKCLLDPSRLVKAHIAQVQGGLHVSGRDWCDLVAFHDAEEGVDPMPMVRVTVEPDPKWQAALAKALPAFVALLEEGKARLRALGIDR